VRREARRVADETRATQVIVDGPPGIGCPVIAALTGADLALAVTEPTVSGEHDLERVLALAGHFGISTAICVNKWDINGEMTERIEKRARAAGAHVAGRIRYDNGVTRAQQAGLTAVEAGVASAAEIEAVWSELGRLSQAPRPSAGRQLTLGRGRPAQTER
jgi:MinD superfamily P-loop ATPase